MGTYTITTDPSSLSLSLPLPPPHPDQRVPVTAVFLHPQEFSSYQIDVDTSITFSLKELRVLTALSNIIQYF